MGLADSLDLLAAPRAQSRVTRETPHRPWPMPERRWIMGQTWMDLLFAHWSVAPAALGRAIPAELPLDTYDGRAWIGVTPFVARNVRARLTPPVPFVSAFGEINVRTYVEVDGKPGIFFFSLDAASGLAVAVARRAYRLPYFEARIVARREGETIAYESTRTSPEAPAPAELRARYRPVGDVFRAEPGSLEHWLAERYCLYTLDERRRVLRGDIHHPPWPLQRAEADIGLNTMAAEVGLELDAEPHLLFVRRQDVVFWRLAPAR